MLQHSFVLDALDTTGADTFEHFEMLINEHRRLEAGKQQSQSNGDCNEPQPSRLKQLVPTIGVFHTPLPLREAFEVYNEKHQITKRKHIAVSFNEIRHILNLAQIMALRKESTADSNGSMENAGSLLNSITAIRSDDLSDHGSPKQLNGPSLITFDGDQTLYSDGANFESNPRLANYLYLLLRHGVSIAVVTAAGYEYNVSIIVFEAPQVDDDDHTSWGPKLPTIHFFFFFLSTVLLRRRKSTNTACRDYCITFNLVAFRKTSVKGFISLVENATICYNWDRTIACIPSRRQDLAVG